MTDIHQDINRVSSFSRCFNGTFPWGNCSVKTLVHLNPNEKSKKYKSCLLSYLTKHLSEHFLQGNTKIPNTKPPFMPWRRSASNDVNDWALDAGEEGVMKGRWPSTPLWPCTSRTWYQLGCLYVRWRPKVRLPHQLFKDLFPVEKVALFQEINWNTQISKVHFV